MLYFRQKESERIQTDKSDYAQVIDQHVIQIIFFLRLIDDNLFEIKKSKNKT